MAEQITENIAKLAVEGEKDNNNNNNNNKEEQEAVVEATKATALVDEIHPEDEKAKVSIKTTAEETTLESHLQATVTFESLGLSKDILDAIYLMKYQKPSQIQATTLPPILAGKNVIGQAQTGSGKTACFVIGMLYAVDQSKSVTQALCLSPTRELTIQSFNVARSIGKYMKARCSVIVPQEGGKYPDTKMTQHAVFGTPGSVLEYIKRRILDISQLKVLAIDEADQMVDQENLGDQTKKIHRLIPKNTQILLFSATYEKVAVYNLAKQLVREPLVEITVKREELSLDGIKQFSVLCSSFEEKYKLVADLFDELTVGQSIIFVNSKQIANPLHARLRQDGHNAAILTSDSSADERDKTMREFRNGKTRVLVSTNLLSRGIDILQINLTINFDIPILYKQPHLPDVETYLHRSGRSARFGRKGITLNFVDNESTKLVDAIADYWKKPIIAVSPIQLSDTLKKALKEL